MASGRIQFVERYTREEIRANPDILYVFGDNMTREGFGGQAAAARHEPNAVGIPTKYSPSKFFKDEDYACAMYTRIYPSFMILRFHLEHGGTVVWPADDIGTGLADLPNKAPKIWARLQELKGKLMEDFNAQDDDNHEE